MRHRQLSPHPRSLSLSHPLSPPTSLSHWPVAPFYDPLTGAHTPAETNFTSLADPDPAAIGSGRVACTTLMHEGGHAAHFANVVSYTPLASQERAPTSVAYAETQSMFLDALVGDAAWLARYARNGAGEAVPWPVVEAHARATRPYAVFGLRAMLAVSFFEKALYELPDDQVTPARVAALADEVEVAIEGGPSPRPLLSVPHILADESSAYYQGYTLAEMAVHQTPRGGGGGGGGGTALCLFLSSLSSSLTSLSSFLLLPSVTGRPAVPPPSPPWSRR